MKKQGGFTLLEILIVLALIGIVVSLGLMTSLDFYKLYNFQSQKNLVLELLYKTRSMAFNNIHQEPHGIYFSTSKYTLFEGPSYLLRNRGNDLDFSINPNFIILGSTEVVFSPLSATAIPISIMLKDDQNNISYIDINYEGGISEH